MRKYLFCSVIFLLSLITLTMPCISIADVIAPEVDRLLTSARGVIDIPVIITRTGAFDISNLRAPNKTVLRRLIVTNLVAQSRTNLVPLIAYLKQNGAQRIRELWMTNSVAAVLPSSTIEQLRTYPGLSIVRLDEVAQLPETLSAAVSPLEWNIAAVGAGDLWNLGYSGTDVIVATMDSGVDIDHLDLAGRWRGGTNSWYDPNDEHPVTPTDKDGHGTAVMSVILGGDATGSAIGVAPGAQWIAVKIFNDAGLTENSAVHLGFQWLLDPDGDPATDDAPDVINNTWGFRDLVDRCYLEFQNDIQILQTAGIAVVFSAGNEGPSPSTSISPANNPESFAVGSIDSNFSIAGTSSRGPSACIIDNDVFPEIVAPGVDIKAADLTFNGLVPDASAYYNGTSFSAPHVAGGLALLMDAFPDMDPEALESALMDSATDLGSAGPDDDYGYGMLNVLAAYRTLVPCTDVDGDGYYVESVCETARDCDDNDPDIHPGAQEIKHDGIDQDCNGYDLTIEITIAAYYPDTDALTVIATSQRMGSAGLQVEGVGPMTWNGPTHTWELTAASVGGDPGTVTVSGAEGSESASTTVCADADGDGFYADETCGTAADCDDADPDVYPGALEVKHDSIDQDCNGYDLTIDIASAIYHPDTDALIVIATSALMGDAGLQVTGIGPMTWNETDQQWEMTASAVGGDPETVTVTGVEGSESAAATACADADGDGFYPGESCGTLVDCDDADPEVYPGATEVKHDDIDQDCNGYDLTIEIINASFRSDTGTLEIIATSALNDTASLVVGGFGPMTWNAQESQWTLTVTGLTENPLSITVSGTEGEETAVVVSCSNVCVSDFNDDGFVNFADLALLRANFGTDCSLLPPEEQCVADATGDGLVNFADLARLRSEFGSSGCLVCN